MSSEVTELAPGVSLAVNTHTTRHIRVEVIVVRVHKGTVTLRAGDRSRVLSTGDVLTLSVDVPPT